MLKLTYDCYAPSILIMELYGACWGFISFVTKKFSSVKVILTTDNWVPTSLLMRIRPMKCLEIDWFL